jgi:hypothetical protein
MTASELIKELQTLAPDTRIVVRGYEDGYNDILELKPVKIKPKPDTRWYDGEFENNADEGAINAVELYGENKNAKDDL